MANTFLENMCAPYIDTVMLKGPIMGIEKYQEVELIFKLYVPVTVHREQSVKREKTNKMQQSDVYYKLLSQHVSGIIMLIFRRTKTVCYCIWCTALVLLVVVGSGCGALPTTTSRTSAVHHMQ